MQRVKTDKVIKIRKNSVPEQTEVRLEGVRFYDSGRWCIYGGSNKRCGFSQHSGCVNFSVLITFSVRLW